MSEDEALLGRVSARLGEVDYAVDLRAGKHQLVADEPASQGGSNAGPGPFSFLLAGLAACTAITLRMYAQRKGWNLTGVNVDAHLLRQGSVSHFDRKISLQGDLDDAKRSRLLEMSDKTPVTLTLKGGIEIRTTLEQPGAA